MLKTTKYIENHLFDGLFVNKRKCLQKIWKKMVAVWSWYFHPAFERRFSGFPFSRSLRHKMTNFTAYVEKERKKTRWHTRRARVRNAMRSWFEYRWTRNREFIKNEQIFLRLSMKSFPREPIYRLSNLIVSFHQYSQKRWISINKLKSESRHLNIHY